jgi:hypothetical protein
MHANAIAVVDGTRRYVFAILDREVYGQPGVHAVITQDGYHHTAARADIEPLPWLVVLPSIKPTLVYRVTEAYDTTQVWETASNYTRYEVQPGDYPVEWRDNLHRPVITAGQTVEYGRVVVDAIERQRHYVNRVLGASSSHDEYPDRPTTLTNDHYAYALTPGLLVAKGKAQYVQIAPAQGEVFPDRTPTVAATASAS